MIKTILANNIICYFFWCYFLYHCKKFTKRKLDQFVEEEKKKNQIILINLLNS